MTPVFRSMCNVMTTVLNSFDALDDASQSALNTSAIQGAQQELFRVNQVIGDVEKATEQAAHAADGYNDAVGQSAQQQQNLNNAVQQAQSPIKQAEAGFRGWQKAIIVANQAIGMIKSTLGQLGVFDLSGAFGRMDTMNQFQKTVTQLSGSSDMAAKSLNYLKNAMKGTPYALDAAAHSAQNLYTRGMSLGAASNQVRVWSDSVAFYGKGTTEQLENVMDAVGKMYSKGKVEMDQLDRLTDAGVNGVQMYAQAVGMGAADVSKALSDGAISAAEFLNVITNTMDSGVSSGAAQAVGDSWAATFANVKSAINRGWVEVIQSLDNALVANGFPTSMQMIQQFGATIEQILGVVSAKVGEVLPYIVQTGEFICGVWEKFSPIILGVVGAYAAYHAILKIGGVIETIQNGIKAISIARAKLQTGATLAEAAATTTATGAQVGLNAALLANPITWIIIIIVALIVIIARWVKSVGGIRIAWDIAMNAILTAWDWFKIGIFTGVFYVQNMLDKLALGWKTVGTAIANFVGDMKVNVLMLLQGMVNGAIDIINKFIGALKTIPGVSIEVIDQVSFGTKSQIENEAKKQAREADLKEYADKVQSNMSDRTAELERMKNDALAATAKRELEIANKQREAEAKSEDEAENENKVQEAENLKDLGGTYIEDPYGVGDSSEKTADNTGRMADSMDSSAEELKWIREIAERQAINKFTTAEVKIDLQNMHNEIKSDDDIDGLVYKLTGKLEEELMILAEGVSV